MAGEISRANGRKSHHGGRPKGRKSEKTLAREAGRAEALREAHITAKRTMLEIGRVAFANRAAMWREGRLLPFEDWPADALALLEGFEVIVKNAAAGDGHTDTVHKVHLAKKLRALELLAKHFGLVQDRVELTAAEPLLAKLDHIKERNRARGALG
jgi:hypothetical protein